MRQPLLCCASLSDAGQCKETMTRRSERIDRSIDPDEDLRAFLRWGTGGVLEPFDGVY